MLGPFLWLLLNGIGVCVENSFIPAVHHPDDYHGNKWWMPSPSKTQTLEEIQKRSKRLIVPRQDTLLPIPDLTKAFELSTPTPQTSQKSRRKGNRNSRKKGNGGGRDDPGKNHRLTGVDRKLKKQGKMKKTNPEFIRAGQSPRRLRQHMQHKKKVKQFLQKRIQEQIEQRNQNSPLYT